MLDSIKSFFVFVFVFGFCSAAYWHLESIVPAAREMFWFIALFGVGAFYLITQPNDTFATMRSETVIWVMLYVAILIIGFMMSSRSETVSFMLTNYFKGLAGFIFIMMLLSSIGAQKAALWALLVVLLFSVGNNIYEFFNESIGWSTIPGRAAGWHFNPNRSGTMIVMSFIFASLLIPRKFFWIVVAVTAFGVIVTFSRGTWVMFFIAVVGVSIIRSAPVDKPLNFLNINAGSFIALVLGTVAAGFFIWGIFSGELYQLIKGTQFENYLGGAEAARLAGETDDGSTRERLLVLQEAIKLGLQNPLVGSGLGATTEWDQRVAPHNEYVLFFGDLGFAGLIIYLALYAMMWFKGGRYGKVFMLTMAFGAIASHNLLDSPGFMIFIVLALMIKEQNFPIKA